MRSKKYAFVEKDRCVACGACRKECPREAIQIYRGCYAQIDEERCVGCGRCAGICPASCIQVLQREVTL